MKTGYLLLLIFLISLVFVSGCIKSAEPDQTIIDACTQACKDALAANKSLESGPCLLDPIPQNTDWVCDVAHSPRQAIDKQLENQCYSYRDGMANHFVEIMPDCQLIRAN